MSNNINFDKPAFGFITNKSLREDIEDALLFSAYLIDAAQKAVEKKYKEEFNRVIVLYVAAVVEALCLFLLEQSDEEKERIEYKNVTPIRIKEISVERGELVVAIKRKVQLRLEDIPFAESVSLLYGAEKINSFLKERLSLLRIKRNSQHLYGRGKNRISSKDVSESIKTLAMLQRRIKLILSNKKPRG